MLSQDFAANVCTKSSSFSVASTAPLVLKTRGAQQPGQAQCLWPNRAGAMSSKRTLRRNIRCAKSGLKALAATVSMRHNQKRTIESHDEKRRTQARVGLPTNQDPGP